MIVEELIDLLNDAPQDARVTLYAEGRYFDIGTANSEDDRGEFVLIAEDQNFEFSDEDDDCFAGLRNP